MCLPKRVRSEKFEAAGVKCRFLGYEGTNFRLWDNEQVIVSSDVEFPIEKAKNFEEQDQKPKSIPFVESQVDELDCISVDPAKAYQPEKRFPGLSLDEVDGLFYARIHLQQTSTHEVCISVDHLSNEVVKRWNIGYRVSWRWDSCHLVTGVPSMRHQSSRHGRFKEKSG